MLPENENTAPNLPDSQSESPMSILERRLAEIAKASQPTGEPAAQPAAPAPDESPAADPAPGQAPAAAEVMPEPTAAPEVITATPEYLAAQGSELPAPDSAPASGTPQTQPDTSMDNADAVAANLADTPSAEESAPEHPVSDAQLRAEQHYGNEGPGAVAKESETSPGATTTKEVTAPPVADEPGATPAPTDVAHQASDEEEEYVPETPVPDFDKLDIVAQGTHLLGLLRRPDARQNRRQILELHRHYEQNINTERSAARQRYADAGNEAESFAFAGPEGYADVTKAVQEYREARVRDAKSEDEQRAKNLARKQELLAQLRNLVESAETKDSSARIKTLQADWKSTGPVPQQQAQELWNSYHALLDIYYNNRGLFFEMKELDRRRNQEAKEALIVRAEALSQQQSINKALQELRQLHEEWKGIGPVPNEMREPLWQRFLLASEKVHERKRTFLDARSAQENANLARKQEILAQILPFGEFRTERVNEWRAKTDELQAFKEQWDSAGLVPRSQAETMNKQFWGAYKGFFQHKNQFFKALDEEKSGNLKRKIELCEQAEAALENPNWEEGREIVIRVQKEWKGIGRVPEKQSDKIWNRFRTACDAFFERKHQESRQREQHAQQLSAEQATRLEQIAVQVAELSADNPGTLEGMQSLVDEWIQYDAQQPGRRGGSAQAEEKFLTLMGKYIDTIPGLTYTEREDQLFNLQVQRLKSSPEAQQLLYRKEQNLRREINELENDVATLQTNLDFFARSKNAGQLREEYQGRIDETKTRIERMKRQLRIVRS